MKIKWTLKQLLEAVEVTLNAKEFGKSYGQRGKAFPGLWIVKDDGIYILSNKKYTDEKSPAVCNEVWYAQGFSPKAKDLWDKCRDAAGGDDFAEVITLKDVLPTLMKHGIVTYDEKFQGKVNWPVAKAFSKAKFYVEFKGDHFSFGYANN